MIKKFFLLLFILVVLYFIPLIAAFDYLHKLVLRKPEKFSVILGKAYGYWGMVMAVNTL